MKVVHLVTLKHGGAAIAANRISEALQECGVDSQVVCLEQLVSQLRIFDIIMLKTRNRLLRKYRTHQAAELYLSFDFLGIQSKVFRKYLDADIIHLHWVCDGIISINNLKKLIKSGSKIVWTLHDMQPFTGGCHYDMNCGKYENICRKCPGLNSNKVIDITKLNQKLKTSLLQQSNIRVVGCSNWITERAKVSTVMKNLNISNIPNCIDVNTFNPIDRELALEVLKLKHIKDKKIILFGAMNATSDSRKGYKYLEESLMLLDKNKYTCIVFGGEKTDIDGMEAYSIGKIHDEITLSILYNCADVFVAPSIQENLANTVMESLSCGTPVVAFDIGGMRDMIVSKYNGYLAEPFSVEDLAFGIEFCCNNTDSSKLRVNARDYVMRHFTYSEISKMYKEIYESIIG